MNSEREKIDKPAGSSVRQGDEKFLNKILSRNSCVGNVSQHYRSIGRVPFQWETIPGTTRTTPSWEMEIPRNESYAEEEEISIRPVRPPPFVERISMPKTVITWEKGKSNLRYSSSFWRSKSIWRRRKKIHQENKDRHVHADIGKRLSFDNSECFKFSNSNDADFIRPSTGNSSSSYSLSLTNSPDAHAHDHVSVQPSKLKGLALKIVNWKF